MGHKHHIIPRHLGGGDEPSNLFECSVEEHAELHLALYLEHGHWEDWIAFHALSGQMSMDDASKEAIRMGQINSQKHWTPEKRSIAARKGNTTEVKKKKSETMKKRRAENPLWVDYTIELRDKISQATKQAQKEMRRKGQRIGRKPKAVLFEGVLYHDIKEMSNTLGIHLQTCYKKIYSGEAQYQ